MLIPLAQVYGTVSKVYEGHLLTEAVYRCPSLEGLYLAQALDNAESWRSVHERWSWVPIIAGESTIEHGMKRDSHEPL